MFNIINKHRDLPDVHAYADDTQLYLVFKPGNNANESDLYNPAFRDIQKWMLIDRLKLNPDKPLRICYSWNKTAT